MKTGAYWWVARLTRNQPWLGRLLTSIRWTRLGVAARELLWKHSSRDAPVLIQGGPLKGKRMHLDCDCPGQMYMGTYEPQLSEWLVTHVTPSTCVYDIGAYVGYYSILLSGLVGPRGKILAFEPLVESARLLRANLLVNKAGNVEVIPSAVGDSLGTTSFYVTSGVASNILDRTPKRASEVRKVPITTIDALVLSHHKPAPDIIKVDVEGAAGQVLQGAQETLLTHGPTVLIEPHGSVELENVQKLLAKVGYTTEWTGNGDGHQVARPSRG